MYIHVKHIGARVQLQNIINCHSLADYTIAFTAGLEEGQKREKYTSFLSCRN